MSTTMSSSFSKFFKSLKLSSTSSSSDKKSTTTATATAAAPSKKKSSASTLSSSSSFSIDSLVSATSRLFRRSRPDPREVVLGDAHREHQEILGNFSMTFGRRGSWATCDMEGISPCTSRR